MKFLRLTTLLLLAAAGSCTAAPPEKVKPPAAAVLPSFDMVDVPSRSVLTGNATEGELGIDTVASYIANPPFTNPGDPENRRLIDSDRPTAD